MIDYDTARIEATAYFLSLLSGSIVQKLTDEELQNMMDAAVATWCKGGRFALSATDMGKVA